MEPSPTRARPADRSGDRLAQRNSNRCRRLPRQTTDPLAPSRLDRGDLGRADHRRLCQPDHGEIPDEIVGSYSFEVFDKPSLIDLEPDGTYVLMTPGGFGQNTVEVTGEYGVFGDEMRFGNEVAANGQACLGDGVYTWSLEGATLTFTLVEDECSAAINRMAEWQSGWTRID